ncbi:MAG TPA: hypothetical protein VLT32_15045 [Candidatus Sulfomarinibacteraceae bacterium]|nr:hypothetical protein [Candidatus Sulfomarinibacteraceae bacterium]
MMCARTAAATLALVLAPALAVAGAREIQVGLQVRPELDVGSRAKVYVGAILLEPRQGGGTTMADIQAIREFQDYIRDLLRRQTRLRVQPQLEGIEPPTLDLGRLVEIPEFWRDVAERSGADYVIAASVDVKVLDREGYTTEEYVSPADGKTYFRQILVEETGFAYDILLVVVDGRTGDVLFRDQITDFKERDERRLDQYDDMFDDLYTLENRLLGIFVPRVVLAKRYLFTD